MGYAQNQVVVSGKSRSKGKEAENRKKRKEKVTYSEIDKVKLCCCCHKFNLRVWDRSRRLIPQVLLHHPPSATHPNSHVGERTHGEGVWPAVADVEREDGVGPRRPLVHQRAPRLARKGTALQQPREKEGREGRV